jgi:hypothetical protein
MIFITAGVQLPREILRYRNFQPLAISLSAAFRKYSSVSKNRPNRLLAVL